MKPMVWFGLGVFLIVASSCEQKPGIRSVEPAMGSVAGGEVVVIRGAGFKPGMSVKFGKRAGTAVIVQSKKINVRTPAGASGKVDVVVTADDGKSFVMKDAYLYKQGGR